MLPDSFTPSLLRQLELLKIRSRRAFLGFRQGGHISPKRGHGIEFSDYRRYELGDNPRHIDWGVYARSDKLFIKTFQEEQELSVLLLLDSSSSMFVPVSDQKWQRACEIALGLSYVALMEHDSVSVAAPGLFQTPFHYGARAIHELSKVVMTPREVPHVDFFREAERAITKVRFPGVAIFLSDFLMPLDQLAKLVNLMRAKNLDITAIQVLGPQDLDPLQGKDDAIAVDSESGERVEISFDRKQREEYAVLLDQHIRRLRELLGAGNVHYSRAETAVPLGEYLIRELPQTGLLR